MSQTIELTPMQEQPDVPMRTSDTQEQFNVKTQNWMVAWKNNVAIWNDNLPVLNAGLNATLAVAYVLPSVERVAQSADNVDRLALSAGNIDRVAQSADNVDTIVPHAANVDAVAGSIVSINTVAADMPAIIDAPNQALVAATSAAEALASKQAAKSSESMAKASETAAKLSETNAKTSENASKASEEEVEAIKDQLIAIAGGDVLTSANLSTDLPLALGKASAGTSTDVARADHVHPVPDNAATADKLSTARTITLTGDLTGSFSFDGSEDVSVKITNNVAIDTTPKPSTLLIPGSIKQQVSGYYPTVKLPSGGTYGYSVTLNGRSYSSTSASGGTVVATIYDSASTTSEAMKIARTYIENSSGTYWRIA